MFNDQFNNNWNYHFLGQQEAQVMKNKIKNQANTFIFPFIVYTGFANITSNGIQPNNAKPSNFAQFSKVISGKEGVVAIWENSLRVWAEKDENGVLIDNFYKKEIRKGTFFKGRLDNSQTGIDFGQSPGANYLGEYTNWSSTKRFTMDIARKLDDTDLYRFYMVPQLTNEGTNDIEIMYISNIETNFDSNGAFVYHRVLFASLNDAIATSGMSIAQYVQFASPGEGYAIPKIIYNGDKAIDFTFDENRAVDRGIDTIQIEILGPAGFTAPIIYGRPIESISKVNDIYAPRDILMREIKLPIPDNLNRQSNPESTFFLTNATPAIVSEYKNWQESMRADFTDSLKKTFDGYLMTNAEDTKFTNPEGLNLRDKNWNFRGKNVININYDTRAVGYFNYVKDDGTQFGSDSINLSQNEKGRIYDIMNISRFVFSWLRSLPIDSLQKITWSLNQIPLIGGFLNKATLGIPVGWRSIDDLSNIAFPGFTGLPIFMSASLYNWYNDAFWSDKGGAGNLPLDMFKNHTDDTVGGIVNAGSMSTTFTFRLSDKVSASEWDIATRQKGETRNVSTLMLGQEKDGKTYLVDEKMSVLEPNSNDDYITDIIGINKYIIDAIGFIGIVKAPVRITMFGNDPDQSINPYSEVVYQTTLQSYSQFTDNVRDIQTLWKLSYLDEFIEAETEFEFPKPLPLPNPNLVFETIQVYLGEHLKVRTNFIDNDTNQWTDGYAAEEFEIYDFADLGFPTWEQVLQKYSNVEVQLPFYNLTYIKNSFNTDLKSFPFDNPQSGSRQISFDLKDLYYNEWKQEGTYYTNGKPNTLYCKNDWNIEFFHDGTKLKLRYSCYQQLSRNSIPGSGSIPRPREWLNGWFSFQSGNYLTIYTK